jgi:hypothetical protein
MFRHMLFRIYPEAGVGFILDKQGGVVVPIPAEARRFYVSKASRQALGTQCVPRTPTRRETDHSLPS